MPLEKISADTWRFTTDGETNSTEFELISSSVTGRELLCWKKITPPDLNPNSVLAFTTNYFPGQPSESVLIDGKFGADDTKMVATVGVGSSVNLVCGNGNKNPNGPIGDNGVYLITAKRVKW